MPKPASVPEVQSDGASSACAEEIQVLSGAAVEPGLIPAAGIFREQTGGNVVVTFATTPEMRRLMCCRRDTAMSRLRRRQHSTSLRNPEKLTARPRSLSAVWVSEL